jgi:hypothetical protein
LRRTGYETARSPKESCSKWILATGVAGGVDLKKTGIANYECDRCGAVMVETGDDLTGQIH